jgi:hypothetical protein
MSTLKRPTIHYLTLLALVGVLSLPLAGCGLAIHNNTAANHEAAAPSAGGPGESISQPQGQHSRQGGTDPASTAMQALERFAGLYVNWNYTTLIADERKLASLSVGPARLAEQQAAAAASADKTIARAQIYNSGTVVEIAQVSGENQRYVVVTHEQTGGAEQYAELQAAYHVTLASVQKLHTGFVVSRWEPQT